MRIRQKNREKNLWYRNVQIVINSPQEIVLRRFRLRSIAGSTDPDSGRDRDHEKSGDIGTLSKQRAEFAFSENDTVKKKKSH